VPEPPLYDVAVIGAGYVGLPLAVTFAEAGSRVLVIDVLPHVVDALNGGRSHIEDITSDRLDIYDKEGRAVYSGASGVVATQGTSKLVGTELTAYYERQHDNGDKAAEGQPQQQSTAGTQVKRILVKGPVSVVQNDQVATGDNGEFDRVQNIVTLTGHVSLTQGASDLRVVPTKAPRGNTCGA